MSAATLHLLIFLVVAPAVYAEDHTVGGSSGWDASGDYTTWAAGEKFTVGDTLVFNYGSSHGLYQVNEDDYTNCATSNPVKTYSGGKTTVTLSSAGPMYFICPTPGHCSNGMKLAVTVSAKETTSSPPTTPSTSTSPPPPDSSSPSGTAASPPPPPPSGEASGFFSMNHWLVGFSLVLAIVIGFMG